MRLARTGSPVFLGFFVLFFSIANRASPAELTPGPNDGRVAYVTARLFEEFHYSQHPFNTEMSERFFDTYLNSLDPQHLYFLQSDIAGFSHYRTNLDTLTLGLYGEADVTPAFIIFTRFMQRLKEREAYADELLKHENLKFDSDEQVQLDRKNTPFPQNIEEAKRIWRQQVLYNVLQEKLAHENFPDATLSETNLADIRRTLEHRYGESLQACEELDSADIFQDYLDSLARAYDPHSDYLNDEGSQDFSITMSLALTGIGAELTSEDGTCKIANLVPGGPAAKSKEIEPNDQIIAVAQGRQAPVDVVNMELRKIIQLIRGPKGTEVRLTIAPVNDPKSRHVVVLIRDEINFKDQEAKAELIESPNDNGGTNRIGIIDIPSFYAPIDLTGNPAIATNYVASDVTELIKELTKEKATGIILDLRNNPGGSLDEAVRLVGLFVTNGPVVQIRSPESALEIAGNDAAPDIYQGPLVVLVNRLSASASEIVAAALQDYGRALIVGDTSTFGKGTVQHLTRLQPFVEMASESTADEPGSLKIVTCKFYRINGASTQLKGVRPNIVLPDVLSYSDEIGEDSLPNALPWDIIPAADYTHLDCVQPYLAMLLKNSELRVATNQDFKYIRQDIAELQKMESKKTDTLNERKAWAENEEVNARKIARENEIASRNTPNEIYYEISVADTSRPSLPPPMQLLKASQMTNSTSQALNSVTEIWKPDPMLDESERILQDYIALWKSLKKKT